VASCHRGLGLPVPTPRSRPPPVFVRQVCAQAMQRRGSLPARAHVYLWSDPEEGYLLFNLFVEVPSCLRPRLLQAPEWGAWLCARTPGPDPTCVCRKMDLYSG